MALFHLPVSLFTSLSGGTKWHCQIFLPSTEHDGDELPSELPPADDIEEEVDRMIDSADDWSDSPADCKLALVLDSPDCLIYKEMHGKVFVETVQIVVESSISKWLFMIDENKSDIDSMIWNTFVLLYFSP